MDYHPEARHSWEEMPRATPQDKKRTMSRDPPGAPTKKPGNPPNTSQSEASSSGNPHDTSPKHYPDDPIHAALKNSLETLRPHEWRCRDIDYHPDARHSWEDMPRTTPQVVRGTTSRAPPEAPTKKPRLADTSWIAPSSGTQPQHMHFHTLLQRHAPPSTSLDTLRRIT